MGTASSYTWAVCTLTFALPTRQLVFQRYVCGELRCRVGQPLMSQVVGGMDVVRALADLPTVKSNSDSGYIKCAAALL